MLIDGNREGEGRERGARHAGGLPRNSREKVYLI